MAAQDGNKTEKPTPQRLKQARERGQFVSTRGLIGALVFGTALVLVSNKLPDWSSTLQRSAITVFEAGIQHELGEADWIHLLRNLAVSTLVPVLMAGSMIMALVLAVHLAITGMGFSVARLTPKFSNLNPMGKLSRLPAQNLKSVIEAILLLAVMGIAIKSLFAQHAAALIRLPFQPVPLAITQVGGMITGLLWKGAAIFILFGAVDFLSEYQRHSATLRMSKQEIKEEMKRNDGDPQIKARIRRLRRDLLRRQMMRDVPKANAVIVNPTHYAVAIRYELDSMPCPVCVAKGKNWLALRIRQIAVENEVPIIENPPLARALYGSIQVGNAIPPEFYKAIAEILAYIYRVMGRKLPS